MYRKLRKN